MTEIPTVSKNLNPALNDFLRIILILFGIGSGAFLILHFAFKRAGIGLGKLEFFRYMLFGKGYGHIRPSEVRDKIDQNIDNVIVVDLRRRDAYEKGHIKRAISAPFNDLIIKRSVALDKGKEIILTCYGGGMSRVAGSILADRGFSKVRNMDGGMFLWHYELERREGSVSA
jgi:rhodanese-related sulfurtransferase